MAHSVELTGSWVHGGEHLRREPRVLGQIEAAAGLSDHLVEAVEDARELGRTNRHVERQGPTLQRERQRARVARAEALEHSQERWDSF